MSVLQSCGDQKMKLTFVLFIYSFTTFVTRQRAAAQGHMLMLKDLNERWNDKSWLSFSHNETLTIEVKLLHAYRFYVKTFGNTVPNVWNWNFHTINRNYQGAIVFQHFHSAKIKSMILSGNFSKKEVKVKFKFRFVQISFINNFFEKITLYYSQSKKSTKKIKFSVYLSSKNPKLSSITNNLLQMSILIKPKSFSQTHNWQNLIKTNTSKVICHSHLDKSAEKRFRKWRNVTIFQCVWKIYHILSRPGMYSVFALAEFEDNLMSAETDVCVLNDRCSPPVVRIDRDVSDRRRKQYYFDRTQEIVVSGRADPNNCFHGSDSKVTWHVVPFAKWPAEKQKITKHLIDEIEISDFKHVETEQRSNKFLLRYPAKSLPGGTYKLVLAFYSKSHCAPDGFMDSDSISIVIGHALESLNQRDPFPMRLVRAVKMARRSKTIPNRNQNHHGSRSNSEPDDKTGKKKNGVPDHESGYCYILPNVGIVLQTYFHIECVDINPPGSSTTYTLTEKKPSTEVKTANDLELIANSLQHAHDVTLRNKTTFKNIQLPLGDSKKGFRLLIQVVVSNEKESTSFGVSEVAVVMPKQNETGNLLQKALKDLKKLANQQNTFGTSRTVRVISSLLKHLSLDKSVLDYSATTLTQLNRIHLTVSDPDHFAVVSASAAVLSEVWSSSTVTYKSKSLIVAVTDFLKNIEKSVLQEMVVNSTMNIKKEHIQVTAKYCLQFVTNAAKYFGNFRSANASKVHLLLENHRLEFLKILSTVQSEKKQDSCVEGESSCLKIQRVNTTEKIIEVKGKDGAGAVVENAIDDGVVVVSTFYFNPFPNSTNATDVGTDENGDEKPDEEDDEEKKEYDKKQDINTPVVGISWFSNDGSKNIPNEKASITYDVAIPLRNHTEAKANALTLHLTPPCDNNIRLTKARVGQFISAARVDKLCGPVSVKFDISSIIEDDDDAREEDETVAYMIIESRVKCRDLDFSCIRVHFVSMMYSSECPGHEDSCVTGYTILNTTSLPLPVDQNSTQKVDPFSIPFSRKFLKKVKANGNFVNVLIEDLYTDPLLSVRQGRNKFHHINVIVIRTICFSWDVKSKVWTDKFCSQPRILVGFRLGCRCIVDKNTSTDGSFDKASPHFFGARLLGLPRSLDLGNLNGLLSKLDERWHIIPIVMCVWLALGCLLLWAKRQDRRVEKQPAFIIPADSDPTSKYLYEVVVFTSAFRNAGTSANVTLVLIGTNGKLSEPHVISDQKRKLLHRGAVDTYLITSNKPLGKVMRVWLWHDNTGVSPSWYLERVAVYDLQAKEDGDNRSYFIANQWLALDLPPYFCHIQLHEATQEKLLSPETRWRANTFHQLREKNFWTSTFSRTSGSHYTCTQRAATCMVLVLGMMLASMTFYGLSSEYGFGFKVGQVSISFLALVVGLESALMIMPVTFIVNIAFRHIDPPQQFAETDFTDLESAVAKNLQDDYDYNDDDDLSSYFQSENNYYSQVTKDMHRSSNGVPKKSKKAEPYYSHEYPNVPGYYNPAADALQFKYRALGAADDHSNMFLNECNNHNKYSCGSISDQTLLGERLKPTLNTKTEKGRLVSNDQVNNNATALKASSENEDNSFTVLKNSAVIDDVGLCDLESAKIRFPIMKSGDPNQILSGGDQLNSPYPSGMQKRIDKSKQYKVEKDSKLELQTLELMSKSNEFDESPLPSRNVSFVNMADDNSKQPQDKKMKRQKSVGEILAMRRWGHSSKRSEHEIQFPEVPGVHCPHNCLWVGWTVVCLYFFVTTAITILYGLQLGRTEIFDWFLTFLSSMLQNLLIISPLKLFLSASFETYWKGAKFDPGEWMGIRSDKERQRAITRWRSIQIQHDREWFQKERRNWILDESSEDTEEFLNIREREIQKLKWCYTLPNFKSMLKAGRLKIAITQVQRFWLEALAWALLTAVLSAILFLQRDVRIYRLNNLYKTYFLSGLDQIEIITDYWKYLDNVFLPVALKENVDAQNATFHLLGAIRIWQVRLRPVDCSARLQTKFKLNRCVPDENDVIWPEQYERRNFTPHWKIVKHLDTVDKHVDKDFHTFITSPWTFTDLGQSLASNPLPGNGLRRNFYPFGGYVADLRYGKESIETTIHGLSRTNWIDNQTSAIFTEAAFYSAFSQHITSVYIAVEHLSLGSIQTTHEVSTYKPPYFYNYRDLTVALMQLIHFIVNLFLIRDLVKQCHEVQWVKTGVYSILVNFWNILAIISIFLSLFAYFLYFTFISYSNQAIKMYKEDAGRFVFFSTCARYEYYYFTFLSVATFTCYLRLLKVFRCSAIVTVMIDALFFARTELFNVSVASFIFIAAFGSIWTLGFGYIKLEFRSFWTSIVSLHALMIGINPEVEEVSGPFYSTIYFFFMMLYIVFLSNMYAVVVESGYTKMRVLQTQRSWDPVETLAVVWLYDNVLTAFGIKHTTFKFLKPQSFVTNANGFNLTLAPSDESGAEEIGSLRRSVKMKRTSSLKPTIKHGLHRERMSRSVMGRPTRQSKKVSKMHHSFLLAPTG